MWKWGWNKEQAPDRLPLLTIAGLSPWCQQSQKSRRERAALSQSRCDGAALKPCPQAVLLPTASSRGNEHYLSAFKSVCFKDDLPHLTISEFPKFSPRYCCCCAPCRAAPRPRRAGGHRLPAGSRLLSSYTEGPPRLLPSAIPGLGMSEETRKPSRWRAEKTKAVTQPCRHVSTPLS